MWPAEPKGTHYTNYFLLCGREARYSSLAITLEGMSEHPLTTGTLKTLLKKQPPEFISVCLSPPLEAYVSYQDLQRTIHHLFVLYNQYDVTNLMNQCDIL